LRRLKIVAQFFAGVTLLDPARQKANQPRRVEKIRDRDRVKTIGLLSGHECLTEPQGGPALDSAFEAAAGQRGDLQNEPISKERRSAHLTKGSIGVAGRVPEDLDLRQLPKG